MCCLLKSFTQFSELGNQYNPRKTLSGEETLKGISTQNFDYNTKNQNSPRLTHILYWHCIKLSKVCHLRGRTGMNNGPCQPAIHRTGMKNESEHLSQNWRRKVKLILKRITLKSPKCIKPWFQDFFRFQLSGFGNLMIREENANKFAS